MKNSDKFITIYILLFIPLTLIINQYLPGISLLAALSTVIIPAVPIHMHFALKERNRGDS